MRLLIVSLALALVFFFSSFLAYAAANAPSTQSTGETGVGAIENPLTNTEDLPDLLTTIMQAVVQVGAVFLVLAIVYVGFLFATAQGNEEKIKTARKALFWTVIGGLILLGAESIALIVSTTAGQL